MLLLAAANPRTTFREPLHLRTTPFCFCYYEKYSKEKKYTYGFLYMDISEAILGLECTETEYSRLPTHPKAEIRSGLPIVLKGEALSNYQMG